MKIVIKVLKGLLLFMTSIWGILLGMVVPLAIIVIGDDIGLESGFSNSFAVWLWFLNSFIFHLGGTLFLMIEKMKVAISMAIVGLVINFIDFQLIDRYYIGAGESKATLLYMPQIFISLLIILIAILVEYPKYAKKKDLENAKIAPSILAPRLDLENTQNSKIKVKNSVKHKMRKG